METSPEELQQARQQWIAHEITAEAVEAVYRRHWKERGDPQAGEWLALLLLQSHRDEEADALLTAIGYTCRLSTAVLNSLGKTQSPTPTTPCRIWDNFLSAAELDLLDEVFTNRSSDYWQSINYRAEPPSPYVSYAMELIRLTDYGLFGRLLQRIHMQLSEWKPTLSSASMVEVWAHHRPSMGAHQLHFDSDNEGRDRIRHPIATAVVYLTDCGGPTLSTTQRLVVVSSTLATRGYLAAPRRGRLMGVDGRVLHGVVPGRPLAEPRVTVMVAPFGSDCECAIKPRRERRGLYTNRCEATI